MQRLSTRDGPQEWMIKRAISLPLSVFVIMRYCGLENRRRARIDRWFPDSGFILSLRSHPRADAAAAAAGAASSLAVHMRGGVGIIRGPGVWARLMRAAACYSADDISMSIILCVCTL